MRDVSQRPRAAISRLPSAQPIKPPSEPSNRTFQSTLSLPTTKVPTCRPKRNSSAPDQRFGAPVTGTRPEQEHDACRDGGDCHKRRSPTRQQDQERGGCLARRAVAQHRNQQQEAENGKRAAEQLAAHTAAELAANAAEPCFKI